MWPAALAPSHGLVITGCGEIPVVRLAAEGLCNAEIAAGMFLSRYTVRDCLRRVFAKLGVESRAELAALAAATAFPQT